MDSKNLIDQARARFDHQAARRCLREKYQAKLNFAHAGGMFQASPEMISFLNLYRDQIIVLEDLYHNPVEVIVNDLLDRMQQRWQEQMNAWYAEYKSIESQR